MTELIEFQTFESRAEASVATAKLIAGQLAHTLDQNPLARASMVVSGGTTPGACFAYLSKTPLDWSRVTVVPSDERWVPAEDPDSNEGLIRRQLLQDHASEARVLPFFRGGMTAEQAPGVVADDLQAIPQPFVITLLGMGEDGHFASMFPDYEWLARALDPDAAAKCIMVQTASSPYQRISLTLSALLQSAAIVLLIFGETKRRVFEAARAGDSGYPVESLLRYANCPLKVMWAA